MAIYIYTAWGIDTSSNWLSYTRKIFENPGGAQLYAQLTGLGANSSCTFTTRRALTNEYISVYPNISNDPRADGSVKSAYLRMHNDTWFNSTLNIYDKIDATIPILSVNVNNRYWRAWS